MDDDPIHPIQSNIQCMLHPRLAESPLPSPPRPATIFSCSSQVLLYFTLRQVSGQTLEHQMIFHTPPRLLYNSTYTCPSCAFRLRAINPTSQRRSITENYIKKTLEAKIQWARQATEIKAGRKESMLTMLEKRGYVNQIIGCVVRGMPITKGKFPADTLAANEVTLTVC